MISIIVPVYGVEKYLNRCVDSLLSQTYSDIEVILVDDGSPDSCPAICDAFAKKDARVKVIHQKNAGVSAARNAGVKLAKGEYIGFVDSDDYISTDMYECMLNEMQRTQVDLVVCGYNYVSEDGTSLRAYEERENCTLTQKEAMRQMFDMPPTLRFVVCNKLFKGKWIKELLFPEEVKGAEDSAVLGKYLEKIEKAIFIHKPLYQTCERVGSATRGGLKEDSILPALEIYNQNRALFVKRYPDLREHLQAYCLDAYLLNLKNVDSKEHKDIYKAVRKLMKKEVPSLLKNREIYWKTKIVYLLFGCGITYRG